jgi:tRNA (adenine22-N1)-methyltransferase
MKLTKRLLACAKYTDGFNTLADIGTDHAYLPIYCVTQGYVSNALAIDNKEGPFVVAYSNVKKERLQDRIQVILGDGLNKITDQVDVVVVSGMGGYVIKTILEQDPHRNVKRFILQPNNAAHEIRASLENLHLKIIDELVIKDQNRYYDILVLESGSQPLSDLEIRFGPLNLKQKPFYFMERIEKEISKLEKLAKKLDNHEDQAQVLSQIEGYKKVL